VEWHPSSFYHFLGQPNNPYIWNVHPYSLHTAAGWATEPLRGCDLRSAASREWWCCHVSVGHPSKRRPGCEISASGTAGTRKFPSTTVQVIGIELSWILYLSWWSLVRLFTVVYFFCKFSCTVLFIYIPKDNQSRTFRWHNFIICFEINFSKERIQLLMEFLSTVCVTGPWNAWACVFDAWSCICRGMTTSFLSVF
jgi:hypothetical protein